MEKMAVLEQNSRQAELGTFERGEKRHPEHPVVFLGHTQLAQGIVVRKKNNYFQVYWKVSELNFVPLHSHEITACACMGGPSWKGCALAR